MFAPPLIHAYAHGDCEQARPLFDSLSHGFCHVEADVWFIDGQLYVSHDEEDVDSSRTLENLYLEPLIERLTAGDGWIYTNGVEFTLLVDIKNAPEETLRVLDGMLEPYSHLLTMFDQEIGVTHRGLMVLLSGERPIESVRTMASRRVFIDGRSPDLRCPIDSSLIPWVSDDWHKLFEWRGISEFPHAESDRLLEMVQTAHQYGSKLRLWSAPDEPIGWQTLLEHGVDLISTDRLEPLANFLRTYQADSGY